MNKEESERITTSQDVISRLHDKIDEQHARIAELEAQVQHAAEIERAAILLRVKNRAVAGALLVEDFRSIVADRGPAPQAVQADVPDGWKLVPVELLERIQESLGSFVSDQGWSQSDMDTADALDGLRAAAPQPPEAGCSVSNGETQAAPVQLPEPVAYQWLSTDNFRISGGPVSGAYWNKLYTEQQVRDLLAAHGIQERST